MAKVQSPQLGYNTNVRHKGKLFHIQTEDSGVARPHIISHLFVDGGRILKSVKTSYADSLDEPDLVAFVRRRMQEQHKAMFVALRDGEYDAMLEPAAVEASGPVAHPPAPEPVETIPPAASDAPPVTPPPRSTLHPTSSTRATGRIAQRATGSREGVAVPGSLLPPGSPAVEQPPSNPPVFSNSMRYTAPRIVAPTSLIPPPARERVEVTARFVREASLSDLILAMLAEELAP
ncbi:MAG: hypothetical protein R3A48_05270 [Polyangiales bacterium]